MKTIDFRVDDGVALLTLNRPEAKNALDPAMADELGEQLAALRMDASVRALVIAGAGGAFCAGGDVKAMGQGGPRTAEQRRDGMARYSRICTELMALDIPVIAAVDGVAFGAGFSIALMCDIVLLSERARLCMVFQRIGLIPDMAAHYTLPRVVGLQRAKELIFSAREVDAAEALRLGIAMEVLPVQALLPRAQAIARSFAGASPVAMGLSKRALRDSLANDLQTLLEVEADGQALASGSDYAKEAVRRFAAREPAQFRWPAASS
ncbi:2-(1,2-epoxy-1,2-dihydrophenyl)acetyl-CoA isomerase [Variovorax sp. OK605]|jgi:2-(1,2-epoxy-1,2-dihydrophenyl)acetyl-CoA isomerase|uniref:enoyl-CoA hydratase/isomerase family protein n=1 Tax=Variovorax sp. OK605 TaxID=1855317 RepID=UPI0008DF2A8A|nr:enoyl-CoA hydratase/isomerase family protein [Variovorax sp. OK605]SFQ53101.1 2-(1,2-epoxy-1,2-dihydrophenyl)acetyl-CoA isomerase [Variovorax sp. OK605]